jgi:hypothetical protein
MFSSEGDCSLALLNPRPAGAESTLTGNVASPFQAEAAHCVFQMNYAKDALLVGFLVVLARIESISRRVCPDLDKVPLLFVAQLAEGFALKACLQRRCSPSWATRPSLVTILLLNTFDAPQLILIRTDTKQSTSCSDSCSQWVFSRNLKAQTDSLRPLLCET